MLKEKVQSLAPHKPRIVEQVCNPGPLEVEVGGGQKFKVNLPYTANSPEREVEESEVQGQPTLYSGNVRLSYAT